MDERTFLVALIIQKPQNGITCFTQVCTSYCRFDCIMCVWHIHTNSETPMPHTRHTHTHIHVCSETFYFMWLPAHGPLSKCVCVWESASVSCPLANIACPSRPTFVYARMRYAGHTSNVCGILGQLKSFKTLDTNRLAPLYVCVCVFVCACGCSSRWSHIIGRHPYANCIPYISGIPFLNRATRKNER